MDVQHLIILCELVLEPFVTTYLYYDRLENVYEVDDYAEIIVYNICVFLVCYEL